MIFKSFKPLRWLRNYKKYHPIINGDRTQMIRTKSGNWVQRYKTTIKKYKI